MKKIFGILGIGLVILILLASIIAGFYLGPIAKLGMEQVGPKVTLTSLTVNAVDVSLITGSASIKDFVLGNPQGYTTPQAISVGTIAVSLAPSSVVSSKILVHSVHVESPEITFEGGLSKNNLNQILDNVNTFSRSGSTSNSTNAPGTSNNKPAPKIEVDDFLITGAKVHINITGLVNKDISLPDIHLTDLGTDSNGLTPAELTSAVLKAISSDTISSVAGSLKNLGQGVQGLGQNAVKTVGNNVSKITGSLGGLFGK